MRALVIGRDGRATALRNALRASRLVEGEVPCLRFASDPNATSALVRAVQEHAPELVFISPEAPLAAGVVDLLQSKLGVRCVGPTRALARLESSKAFTRGLLSRHGIAGNPEHRTFESLDGLEAYLRRLGDFVVKPDGLTGGKGVKVSGAHLGSVAEGVEYAREVLTAHPAVVVEEKLDGEEFSLQSFCDGETVVDMPVVQDHKRAFDGDEGPNTGGMGSYSCEDHRLPFLTEEHVRAASAVNAAVARALLRETGERYKGILYGGFMVTGQGVRLLEYNARFGDPEALNVLSVLDTDFGEICQAIVEERLAAQRIAFRRLATVCKYVVPEGYPDSPARDRRISLARVPPESDRLRHFVAALDQRDGEWYLTGSRAIAFVGVGPALGAAEAIAEEAARAVEGPVFHRKDIGTAALVGSRCEHARQLLGASGPRAG